MASAIDYEISGIAILLLLWVASEMTTERRHRRIEQLGRLPPGPRPLPLVGNIFQLGWSPHESLAHHARAHGPIMTLYPGSMCTVVISSKQAAGTMFKSYDVALAGRKIYESMKGSKSRDGSIITAQYGPHWRMLRRLCTMEFFVGHRLEATQPVRSRCVDRMIRFIDEARVHEPVDLGRFIFLMAFNLVGNLMFSRDLLDPKSERGARFFHHAGKVMEFAGKPNVADFFPSLSRFDPQRIRRNTQFHVERAFEIAGEFIKERLVEMEGTCRDNGSDHNEDEKKKDFLDVLLGFRGEGVDEPAKFSSRMINVIVFASLFSEKIPKYMGN